MTDFDYDSLPEPLVQPVSPPPPSSPRDAALAELRAIRELLEQIAAQQRTDARMHKRAGNPGNIAAGIIIAAVVLFVAAIVLGY